MFVAAATRLTSAGGSDGERRIVANLGVWLAVDLAGRFLDPFNQEAGLPLRHSFAFDAAILVGLDFDGIALFRIRFHDGARGRPTAKADDHHGRLPLFFDQAGPQEIGEFGIRRARRLELHAGCVEQAKGLLASFHDSQVAEPVDDLGEPLGKADAVGIFLF